MERKTKIKDMSYMSYEEDDEKDFHVKTVADETLITPNGGLDDEEEFVCDMHNFGDSDDLPVRFYRIKKYLNMYDRIHSAAKRRQQ